MQKSFWWWQCSDRYIISLFPPPLNHFPPFSPSLISLMVSVDVKHHVYFSLSLTLLSVCASFTVTEEFLLHSWCRLGSFESVEEFLLHWLLVLVLAATRLSQSLVLLTLRPRAEGFAGEDSVSHAPAMLITVKRFFFFFFSVDTSCAGLAKVVSYSYTPHAGFNQDWHAFLLYCSCNDYTDTNNPRLIDDRLYSAILRSLEQTHCRSHVILHEWLAFQVIARRFFNIRWHRSGVLTAGMVGATLKLQPCGRKFCVNHTTMFHVTSCKATYVRSVCMHVWL